MINLENLTVVKDFGKNDVYESLIAVNNADNVRYFVKKTTKSILEDEIKNKYYENELVVNEEIDHSNIIKFIAKKEILNDIYLLYECTNGGSLANYMKKYMDKFNKPFPEEIVQNIMKQVCPALKYIHDHHIIHRCFDLDNIYIEFPNLEDKANFDLSKAIFKIGNFHFSKKLDENALAHSFVGAPIYMDPHMLFKSNQQNEEGYDYSVDIWSLGCVCYELLSGTTPFDGESFEDLVAKVKAGTYKFSKNLNLSKEVISFITGMLQYNIGKRLGIEDIVKHEFLTKNVSDFSHDGLDQFGEVKGDELVVNIQIDE